MKLEETILQGVLVITPKLYHDDRGFFLESYNQKVFYEMGIRATFVQDNHSQSNLGVVRGLHFQIKGPQGKLVRCTSGRILDVVLDIRRKSPTYGKHFTIEINDQNKKMLWIPPGLAHGFSVLSLVADVQYKVTDFYKPEDEGGILWNDPELGIDWKVIQPIISTKDESLPLFREASINFPLL